MSGIAGLVYLDTKKAQPEQIRQMTDRLSHRGHDDDGCLACGPAGLGHRMLWTTPESLQEKLPAPDESGQFVITADARIDNREELISLLGLSRFSDSVITDSQLILEAYKKWGEACPSRLLGDFAFAIWDNPRQTLFCARDHFGIKPFYYYKSGKIFAFASEIKALFAIEEIPREINETRIADFLVPTTEDKIITFYKGIHRLPPASSLIVSRKGFELKQYWELDQNAVIRLKSDKEYAEAFRDVFTKAVACRLRSAYPIGVMLSGGLDSSSIASVARNILQKEGKQLHTVSGMYPDLKQCDESEYIEAVTSLDGIKAHYVIADQMNPLEDIEHALYHQDGLFLGPNIFFDSALYKEAQRNNIRVFMDGFDGDIVVYHGVQYLMEHFRKFRWLRLYKEVMGLSRNFGSPPTAILKGHAIHPAIPDTVRALAKKIRKNKEKTLWDPFIKKEFAEEMGLKERIASLAAPRYRTAKEYHYRGLSSGVIPYITEAINKDASSFGLELRHPFFDRRLVELSLAIPVSQKIRNGFTRLILRNAMQGILPEKIRLRRTKSDMSHLLTRNLQLYNNDLIEGLLAEMDNQKALSRYIDLERLRTVHQQYSQKPCAADAYTLWKAIVLSLWLKGKWDKHDA
ncbi:MAG: lasso peptide isopeptide bond-forming cyclase [Thermodesulfovibrionales bacterium]|jgi:asparagine synthase (glutamine-hydrolysing)